MNRFFFIALASLTVCAAGCTQKELLPADPFADAKWAFDKALPVPIEFGSGELFTIETKASETALTSMENKHFAIVATDGFANVTSATPLEGNDHLLLNGAIAKGVEEPASSGIIETKFVDGSDNVIKHYYPMPGGTEHPELNYTFYAYRTTDESTDEPALVMDGSTLKTTIDFELNPQTNNIDVLWASASATTYSGQAGFNAEYIRKIKAAGSATYAANKPSLSFTHAASCLHFRVKSYGADASARAATAATFVQDAGAGDTQSLTVSDVKISGVKTDVRLDVANGSLVEVGYHSPADVNTLYAIQDGAAITPDDSEDGIEYGTGVYVAPGDRESRRYTVSFKVTDKKGNESTMTGTLALPSSGAYAANTSYTYSIVIKSVEEISIVTSVSAFTGYSGTFESGYDIVVGD